MLERETFFFFFDFSALGNALEGDPIPATTTEAVEVAEDETGASFETGLLTATPVLGGALGNHYGSISG